MNSKVSRRNEIKRFKWAEINGIENRKSVIKINKTKSWLLEKINKINKPFTKLWKKETWHKFLISEMKEELSL